jgi:hypothetical protein
MTDCVFVAFKSHFIFSCRPALEADEPLVVVLKVLLYIFNWFKSGVSLPNSVTYRANRIIFFALAAMRTTRPLEKYYLCGLRNNFLYQRHYITGIWLFEQYVTGASQDHYCIRTMHPIIALIFLCNNFSCSCWSQEVLFTMVRQLLSFGFFLNFSLF